ncbi:MAG: hypothetical protein ACREDR_02300 [Blastocatellia bacterium]
MRASGGPAATTDLITARCAAALGEIGDPSVIPILQQLLDNQLEPKDSTYVIRLAIKKLKARSR